MIDAIVRLSVDRRYFMLSLILVLIGVGVWSFQRLPIDAVPDITNVQVQINTQARVTPPWRPSSASHSRWKRRCTVCPICPTPALCLAMACPK